MKILKWLDNAVVWVLISFLDLWHLVSVALLPCRCRFNPSCSRYAVESLRRYGVLKGGLLSINRVSRCNSFFKGGDDPVP